VLLIGAALIVQSFRLIYANMQMRNRSTCFPDSGNGVWLILDQVADVMSTGMNYSAAFVVHYTRIHTCRQRTAAAPSPDIL